MTTHRGFTRNPPAASSSTLGSPTAITNVSNPSATTSATSVFSGSYQAGGNISFSNTIVADSILLSGASGVSTWLADLASVNQYAIHKDTYQKVTSGTCKWMLDAPEFIQWASKPGGVFWGVGIPGAGKTILSSFIVNHLQDQAQTEEAGCVVTFVYCRYMDVLSVSNILAALLMQLVNQSPKVMQLVKECLFDTCKELGTPPTSDELKKTLETSLALVPKAFIILDALDELDELVREETIQLLTSLESNLFVTSRELELDDLSPNIRIEAPKSDFLTFVEHEVQKLPKVRSLLQKRPEVMKEVVERIQLKSDGMFLLSALQVAALRGVTSIKSLRESIEKLPATLGAMYDVTIARIKAQSEEESLLALRAILLVTHAARPFRTSELLKALAVDPDSTEFDEDAMTDERTLVSVCCGLLECNEKTRPRLIHYTAHDFFKDRALDLHSDPHAFLACICAGYQQFLLPNPIRDSVEFEDTPHWYTLLKLTRADKLLGYAIRKLGFHTLQHSVQNSGAIPDFVRQFLHEQRFSLVHLDLDVSLEMSDPRPSLNIDIINILHFAAFHGLLDLLEEYIDDDSLLCGRSDEGFTVLMYACIGGHLSVVERLVQTRKADIDAEIRALRRPWPDAYTALTIAAHFSHDAIVDLLLKSGASAKIGYPLITTLRHGVKYKYIHNSVVKLLNHPDTSINNIYDGYTALTACLRFRFFDCDTLRLLLSHPSIDIALPHSDGGAFLVATAWSSVQSLRLVLDHPGIDVTVKTSSRETALHIAAATRLRTEEDAAEAVQLLLTIPAMASLVNEQNDQGDTALHYVCYPTQPNFAILEALLKCPEIDVNVKNDDGWTPLQPVLCNNDELTVRALLEHPTKLNISRSDSPNLCETFGSKVVEAPLEEESGKPLRQHSLDSTWSVSDDGNSSDSEDGFNEPYPLGDPDAVVYNI